MDLISRQAALDALLQCRKHCIDPFDSYHIDIQDAEARIRRVPAAPPERKHGTWIKHAKGFWTFVNANGERDGWFPDYECSECGSSGHDMICVYNFCPMCGAEMEMESEWT